MGEAAVGPPPPESSGARAEQGVGGWSGREYQEGSEDTHQKREQLLPLGHGLFFVSFLKGHFDI